MRALLVLVFAAALLWGGYWFVGARAAENAAETWFESQTAQGWIAEKDSLTLAGFPSRFDVTVEGVHLADPDRQFDFRAAFVQVLSLSYRPWHIIVALPNTFDLQIDGQNLRIASAKMQASLKVQPKPALPLDRFASEADRLQIASDFGWDLAAERVRFATRRDAASVNGHEIGLEIKGLRPVGGLRSTLVAQGLPEEMEEARLTILVDLSAPIDRFSEVNPPQIKRVSVQEGLMRWGKMVLFVKGEVAPDSEGLAEGRLELRLENWRDALVAAQTLGLIPPQLQKTAEAMAHGLAEAGGNPDVLTLPMVFAGGRMSLGPLPLGRAPRLR